VWLSCRGAVQHPQCPGGGTAAVTSQSRCFILYHVICCSFQSDSRVATAPTLSFVCTHVAACMLFLCSQKNKTPSTHSTALRTVPPEVADWLVNPKWPLARSLVGQKCPNRHELNGKRGPQHPTPWGPKHPQCSVFRLAGATNSCWHSGTV